MKNIKIKLIIHIILYVTGLLLIYLISPKISLLVQNIARFLFEIEKVEITRIIELTMTIAFVFFIKIKRR